MQTSPHQLRTAKQGICASPFHMMGYLWFSHSIIFKISCIHLYFAPAIRNLSRQNYSVPLEGFVSARRQAERFRWNIHFSGLQSRIGADSPSMARQTPGTPSMVFLRLMLHYEMRVSLRNRRNVTLPDSEPLVAATWALNSFIYIVTKKLSENILLTHSKNGYIITIELVLTRLMYYAKIKLDRKQ